MNNRFWTPLVIPYSLKWENIAKMRVWALQFEPHDVEQGWRNSYNKEK